MDIHPKVISILAPWGRGSHVVLYVLRGEKLAIIDTGADDTPESVVAPALAEHGLRLADIDVILNTHGHHDHLGGNSSVASASGAKVFISKDEDQRLLPGATRNIVEIFRPLEPILGAEQHKSFLDDTIRWSGGSFEVHRTLGHGDVVDLGGGIELEVVAIPGHSPGSIGYYWRQEGIMFAGDAMNGRGSKIGVLPIICDAAAYEASISRLMKLPLRTLCSCHNYASFELPGVAVRHGSDIQTFLQECDYVSKELRAAAERAVKAEPQASLWRQGERLVEELPASFLVPSLPDVLRSLWSAMGVYSYIWQARKTL